MTEYTRKTILGLMAIFAFSTAYIQDTQAQTMQYSSFTSSTPLQEAIHDKIQFLTKEGREVCGEAPWGFEKSNCYDEFTAMKVRLLEKYTDNALTAKDLQTIPNSQKQITINIKR